MTGFSSGRRRGSNGVPSALTRDSHITQPESLIESRYQPLRKVGDGIIGDVFLVHDRMKGDIVALKRLNAQFRNNPHAIDQLSVEIAALQKISHPSIVRFIEKNSWPWNHFFTMEYLEGAPLSRTDRSFLRDLGNSLPISVTVLEALAALHAAGIVHRDVKCGNVMLNRGPQQMGVKLFDFSTAYVPGLYDCASQQAVGTLEFLPPECWEINAKADPRSDIYSWGVAMHEMIGGSLPFYSSSLPELMDMHRNIVPTPLHLIYPHIPIQVSQIISRALEKEPEKRFQSAIEMKDAVACCIGTMGF